ncbi:MAG: UbiA family prenyltransferase [Bacteroidia bacterium]|nr:UbiA family prenyltransferase [Bacteroidia bacterium]
MKKLKNVLVSVRFLNVVTVCIYVYLSFSVFPEMYGAALLFTAATALSLMAGNMLNDYYDTETDRINKPGRPSLVMLFGPRNTVRIYLGTLLAAVLCAIATLSLYAMGIVLLANLLLAFYARYGKYTGFAGNVLVAFLSGLSVFAPYLLVTEKQPWNSKWELLNEAYVQPLVLCSVLAFFFSLLREWIKDLEDHEGDRRAGFKTGVVLLGPVAAVWLCRLGLLVCQGALLVLAWRLNNWVGIVWLLLFSLVVIVLWTGSEKRHFRMASALLKVVFLSGILAYFYL